MLRFSLIDDELNIYKENKVVLFGAGTFGKEMLNTFLSLGIKPYAFCDNDVKKHGSIIEGLPVLPFEAVIKEKDNIIIQITTLSEREIEKQLVHSDVQKYITLTEFRQRIYDYGKYHTFNTEDKKKEYIEKSGILNALRTKNEWPLWDYIGLANVLDFDDFLILCLPPKTGDWTLNATLDRYNKNYVNFWHSYRHMTGTVEKFLEGKRKKIVTAVREPIGQNISIFFNMSDTFWDVPEYWRNGGNVQLLFDSWVRHEMGDEYVPMSSTDEDIDRIDFTYFNAFKNSENVDYIIQNFFDKQFFKYNKINILDYPFDKTAGYSVIHLGQADIFIYQLERMNDIKGALGDFLGIPNICYINENIGDDKWYSRVYRKAMENLELTKEYIDSTYSSPLVTHFYSSDDIKSFREKWQKHVK